MKFSQFVQQLGLSPETTSLVQYPTLNPDITGVAAIAEATPGTVSFVEGERMAPHLSQTQASGLILPAKPSFQTQATQQGLAWIVTDQPRLLFAQAIALFYAPWHPAPDIHPTAVIDPSVTLGTGIAVGAHTTIHADVTLGNEVCIHANVVIYPEVVVGDRTILHANCVLHERTTIGQDCIIHSGAVIGAEGFGFVPIAGGWQKMPQSGRTILEDNVEVGCQSAIDRPAVGETRIGQGTKIDNLVQIGHGCQVGPNCALAGQVGLAGRVQLGAGVILAGQVGVADQIQVGAGAIATAKTGISQQVAAETVVSGNIPGMPNRQWLRMVTLMRRLPELFRSLQQLQQRLPR